MTQRVLLVGNPTAQSGKNAERIAVARKAMDARGLHHELLHTAPAGATVGQVSAALQADRSLGMVVAMGGDGTFAEVAKGLLGSGRAGEVVLGMLPTGTANDQGKSFGLSSAPEAIEANVAVLAGSGEQALDAGRLLLEDEAGQMLKEELFFDSAGWGLSPAVLKLRNEDRETVSQVPLLRELYRDHLVYAGALLRTWAVGYAVDTKFDVDGTLDDVPFHLEGLTDLVVKATRVYGGMWVFDPTSRPDDGLFELVPFVGRRDWVSKVMVHLDASGNLEKSLGDVGVHHSPVRRAASFKLRFHAHQAPIYGQIDGEELTASPRVRIDVLPRALRLRVPSPDGT